jgi:dTDP-4-amino-4,6-dideoxygalactose transaminase
LSIPQIDLWSQHHECELDIREALDAVVRESAFIAGRFVRDFEAAFAQYCGVSYCIGVGNGTDALALALRAVGVGPGDSVVTVPFTFAATVEAIWHVGARPLLVDIDPTTYTIDLAALSTLLQREPRVKAIIPVHLFGHPAAMDQICALAASVGAYVIEDACQAHGAWWQGKRVGGWGQLNCFSFYPTKNLGAMGDGGALTTDDAELAQKVRLLADHGQSRKYEHTCLGWNSRLDGLQAAVLAVKLQRLDTWNVRRRRWAEVYCQRLQETSLRLPSEQRDAFHVYHLFVTRTPQRDGLCEFLKARGIAIGLHYPVPLHLQPAFASLGYRVGDFPVAEACARECLSLPLFPHLSEEQVERVCESVWAWDRRIH